GVLDEVGDRPHARRLRRDRGGRHAAGAPRPHRPPNARLGGARGGTRSRLCAGQRTPAGPCPRRDRDLQFVRLRRSQRDALPARHGVMTTKLSLAPRPAETLGPMERLETLCDPGSIQLVRGDVVSRRMGSRTAAGDGVIGATGRVDGRPIACFAQDPAYLGGSLGEAHADTICRVMTVAGRAQIPLVGFVESAGARLQEGVAALCGYGRIFRANTLLSGVVPQISVICGASAGGGSYSPALTDFVVMTKRASMFLTGPGIVREVTGEDVDAATLGGPKVHHRNGVCQLVCEDDVDAAWTVRDLLDHLPQNSGANANRWPTAEPSPGLPDGPIPVDNRKVYDVRDVARTLVDGGRLLEVSSRWARNVTTAFARIDGRAVGVVANNPRYLGGVLDAKSATKAARFVRTCDLYGLPLLVLVDTPGFLPGTKQEYGGVIRHGAKLATRSPPPPSRGSRWCYARPLAGRSSR